jgi:hypothetical protein
MSRRKGAVAVATLLATAVWGSGGAPDVTAAPSCLEGSPARLAVQDGRQLTIRLYSITRSDRGHDISPARCRVWLARGLAEQDVTLRLPVAASRVRVAISCVIRRGDDAGRGTTYRLTRISPRVWQGRVQPTGSTPLCDLFFLATSVGRETERGYLVSW